MSNILVEIANKTRERISEEEKKTPLSEVQKKIEERIAREKAENRPLPDFLAALKKDGMSYICEVKKASPSKGLIAPDFPYVEIAKDIFFRL